MRRFEGAKALLHIDDVPHIEDEFRRHASASTIFGSFLSLFSSPVLFVGGFPEISYKYLLISAAVFLSFSFLPDILRFFCNAFKLDAANALSHSFIGALVFSGILMLALAPLDIWRLPLFILALLGYLLHLFVDSAESAIEWWINGMQSVLSAQPFASLKRCRKVRKSGQ